MLWLTIMVKVKKIFFFFVFFFVKCFFSLSMTFIHFRWEILLTGLNSLNLWKISIIIKTSDGTFNNFDNSVSISVKTLLIYITLFQRLSRYFDLIEWINNLDTLPNFLSMSKALYSISAFLLNFEKFDFTQKFVL